MESVLSHTKCAEARTTGEHSAVQPARQVQLPANRTESTSVREILIIMVCGTRLHTQRLVVDVKLLSPTAELNLQRVKTPSSRGDTWSSVADPSSRGYSD
ncbi:hypothetical protein P7K49_004451 [Saguinus oedipus]|uniref:Uncharacterized protein n=1 Tax=Saguinus oedipus TaxID=9490 RepID=A0ABQ9W7U6_SAGOE|nr:hypothetical protein P7K49_004451 [Saguinus oedipus]